MKWDRERQEEISVYERNIGYPSFRHHLWHLA
jgi:hypothetical protein